MSICVIEGVHTLIGSILSFSACLLLRSPTPISPASSTATRSSPSFALLVKRSRNAHGHRRRTLLLTRPFYSVSILMPRLSVGRNCVCVGSFVVLSLYLTCFLSQTGASEEEAREEGQAEDCFQGIPRHPFRTLISY